MSKHQIPVMGSIGKWRITCHGPPFIKISAMIEISKPRLAVKIYTFWRNLSNLSYRKEEAN
jgi:hypothetical protein